MRLIFRLLPITAALLIALPASASAAMTMVTDAAYTTAASPCALQGQSDDSGTMYAICGNNIARFDKNGTRLADIRLPAGTTNSGDVAPSPDGAYLYVSPGNSTIRRLNRVSAASYTLDTKWALEKYDYWGATFAPQGWIATDGLGDIYASDRSRSVIVKYHPDGTFVTWFGDYGKEPGKWINNQGLAVSRDGRRVFIGENCGTSCIWGAKDYMSSRITRYDYSPAGTYKFSRIESAQGPMDGQSYPGCDSKGAVHSGYSVALDAFENLYATSVSCGKIQMFSTNADPKKDTFVKTIATYSDWVNGAVRPSKNHYISSDWAGRIYAYEWKQVIVPKQPNPPKSLAPVTPLPGPDIEAPKLTDLKVPAFTSKQTISLTTTATDNVAVSEMRFANEDGTWTAWAPYSAISTWKLSPGYAGKGVFAQVRDMAGNESNSVYKTLRYDVADQGGGGGGGGQGGGAADHADPILTAVTGPSVVGTSIITIGLTATDDVAVTRMRFANEDGVFSAWEPIAATKDWTLSPGYTYKVVFAQVSDGAGKTSAVLQLRTRVMQDAPQDPPPAGAADDATAPTLVGITLPKETTKQTVTVKVDATDNVGLSQIRFANEDGNWAAWQPYANPATWTLTTGYTGKLVFAQVRDAAGNESSVQRAPTSYVKTTAGPTDQEAPVLTAIIMPETSATRNITISLDARDDIGVTEMRFANEDGNWGTWKPWSPKVQYQVTAGNTWKVVSAQVRDAAGHESNVLFAKTLVSP